MSDIPERFPKVESPYRRAEDSNGNYVVDPDGEFLGTKEKFEWVFDRASEVEAVEKIDGCFTYGSRVQTRDSGSVPIGKIVNNELNVDVLSYNFSSNQVEYKRISGYHKYDSETPLVTVSICHNTHGGNKRAFVATQDHEVWTDDGWVEAGNLTEEHTVYRSGPKVDSVTEQILIGTVLGDGTVESISNPTVKFTHGAEQKKYLDWKINNISLETSTRDLGKGGYNGSSERDEVRVKTDPQSSSIASMFLDDNDDKMIPEDISDVLRPLGLAIWYMDDGTLGSGNDGQRPRSVFSTNSFTEDEAHRLMSVLENKFDVGCRVASYGDGPRIELTANGTENLHEYIWPYIIDDMDYKLLEQYRGTGTCIDSYSSDTSDSLVESNVVSVDDGADEWRNTSSVYDLTVESNHNYFVGGVLVHNTNMAVRLRDPSKFEHDPPMVVDVATRMGDKSMNEVDPFGPTNHHYITRAVQNSKRRGYLDYLLDEHGTGWFFGEAVGPKMQGNPHELDEHLFVPFEWIRDKLEYRSYGDYPTDFESIRDWFRGEANGLFSLFASRMHGQDLEASRPTNGTFVEGLVLIHPDFDGRIRPRDLTLGNDGRSVKELAKLRRDQFGAFARGEWPLTDYSHH